MTTLHISNAYEHPIARCDNCGTVHLVGNLNPIVDAEQRLEAGCEIPAGECPAENCGALAYVIKETANG